MRWKLLSAVAALVLILNADFLDADPNAEVVFNWAFVRQQPDGELRALDSSGRVSVEAGGAFKIFIQPGPNSFVYLFLHDAQNELHLLFPERFEDLSSRDYSGRKYFLPEGDEWFVPDEATGVEKFHLLVSGERFPKLEALARTYLDLKAKAKSPPAALRAAMQRVLEEITRIRQRHSSLIAAAERPVSVAGGVRGQNRTIEELATEIRAQGFYSKTFRLEH